MWEFFLSRAPPPPLPAPPPIPPLPSPSPPLRPPPRSPPLLFFLPTKTRHNKLNQQCNEPRANYLHKYMLTAAAVQRKADAYPGFRSFFLGAPLPVSGCGRFPVLCCCGRLSTLRLLLLSCGSLHPPLSDVHPLPSDSLQLGAPPPSEVLHSPPCGSLQGYSAVRMTYARSTICSSVSVSILLAILFASTSLSASAWFQKSTLQLT